MEDFLFPWSNQRNSHQRQRANASAPNPNKRPSLLPTPPPGQEWYQDKQTKEWKLVRSSLMTAAVETSSTALPTISKQAATRTTSTSTSLRIPPKSPASNSPRVIVHNIPTDTSGNSEVDEEDDWDLVSDKVSSSDDPKSTPARRSCSNNIDKHLVTAGSVRSIDDISGAESVTSSVKRRLSKTNHPRTDDDASSVASSSFGLNPYGGGTGSKASSCSLASSFVSSLGPSGQGILGVDYLEHVVLPTDTLQGICLAYKVHATKLRQANHFSGNSLLLAPKKLVIPISSKALKAGFLRVQDTDAKEYKVYSFLAEYPDFGVDEAKAYLEMSDWVLKEALQSAKEDVEWEHGVLDEEEDDDSTTKDAALKAGQIRIHQHGNNVNVKGAGFAVSKIMQSGMNQVGKLVASSASALSNTSTSAAAKEKIKDAATSTIVLVSDDEDEDGRSTTKNNDAETKDKKQDMHDNNPESANKTSPPRETNKQPVIYRALPAIASKSALPQDLLHASPQHDAFGVELQDMATSTNTPNTHLVKKPLLPPGRP